MIEMGPELATLVMFGLLFVGLLSGYPVGILMVFLAVFVGFLVKGPRALELSYLTFFGVLQNYILLAIPLFVLMGAMLQESGLAEKMYHALFIVMGRLRGGLALTTVVLGAMLATCMGVITASVTTLALIALPSMVKRGYSKSLLSATTTAGGVLGILIPPSIMLIVFGTAAGVSVGKLFMAAFIPGFTLAGLYMLYIAVRCIIQPELAPAVDPQDVSVSAREKVGVLVKSVLPMAALILAVLGTIYFGVAPPTEAAAMGASGMFVLAVVYRRFNMGLLKRSIFTTLTTTCMIAWIAIGALMYANIFMFLGCREFVVNVVTGLPIGPWGIFTTIMVIVFILGMFIDWMGIVFIMTPIIMPITTALGFDPLWVALMVCINLQMAFLSPPFAPGIFVLRAATRAEYGISTMTIISGIWPFIICVAIVLVLCAVFPQMILWLPSTMSG